MANRFPLIVDSTNNNIKELPSGDNLDMTGSGFANLASLSPTAISATAYNETAVTVTSSSNATAISCAAGNSFIHTLTENTTFSFTNAPSSGASFAFTLKLIQDSTARTVTWPTLKWAAGTAPTITTTSGGIDVFVFYHDGTGWFGFTAGQAMA